MEALGFNWEWFAFQLVNFGVLMAVLNHFLHKPLIRLLDKRKSDVAEAIKQQERIAKELAETEKRQKATLSAAQAQAQAILDAAHGQAKELEEHLEQKASENLQRLVSRAKSDIELERKQMRDELRRSLAGLVIQTTEKVLRQDIPDDLKQNGLANEVGGLSL